MSSEKIKTDDQNNLRFTVWETPSRTCISCSNFHHTHTALSIALSASHIKSQLKTSPNVPFTLNLSPYSLHVRVPFSTCIINHIYLSIHLFTGKYRLVQFTPSLVLPSSWSKYHIFFFSLRYNNRALKIIMKPVHQIYTHIHLHY